MSPSLQVKRSWLGSSKKDEGLSRVATFNVRGLSSKFKKCQLISDLKNYQVGLCCLQETKISEGFDGVIDGHRLICLPTSCRHYGLGFAVDGSVASRIHRYWSVNDRIAVIQIWLSERTLCSIVNVYCIGSHARGKRNYNGTTLADFADSQQLFACNTAFQHRAAHITTWTGWRHNPDGGPSIPVYNQIDYIFCRHSERYIITDARSYSGASLDSDHRIVIANINLTNLYKKLNKATSTRVSSEKLDVAEFCNLYTRTC